MTDQHDETLLRNLSRDISQCRSEIIILKGAVAALLGVSSIKQQDLNKMVEAASKQPVGYGDPGSAADTSAFFEEIISRRDS